MAEQPDVLALTETTIPWRARRKIAKAKRAHRTGLVLAGVIRTPARAASLVQPVVSVRGRTGALGVVSPRSKAPKWAALPVGTHVLRFSTTRGTFEREVELRAGQVLVTICEPVQPWSLFGRSPSVDRWHIGVV